MKEYYYGNPEKGIAPIPAFVEEMNANPDIWRVAQRIEGLISKRGRHAAGVICTNEPIENFTAVMRSPDGTLVTQLDLDDVSYCGGLKFDCLTTNALDRIRVVKICYGTCSEHTHTIAQGGLCPGSSTE